MPEAIIEVRSNRLIVYEKITIRDWQKMLQRMPYDKGVEMEQWSEVPKYQVSYLPTYVDLK